MLPHPARATSWFVRVIEQTHVTGDHVDCSHSVHFLGVFLCPEGHCAASLGIVPVLSLPCNSEYDQNSLWPSLLCPLHVLVTFFLGFQVLGPQRPSVRSLLCHRPVLWALQSFQCCFDPGVLVLFEEQQQTRGRALLSAHSLCSVREWLRIQ